MPNSPETQLLRVALPITLVAMLIGVMLWIARASIQPAQAPTAVAALAVEGASAIPLQRAEPVAPLPTIGARQATRHMAEPSRSLSVPTMTPQATSTASSVVAGTAVSTTDTALAARLAQHLTCLAPHALHNAALDARAAGLAGQNDFSLPTTGAIQIAETNGQRFLLGTDALAGLRAADGRCGETLIFGIPPIEWLPAGARFGVGLATHTNGAVVVVVVVAR